MLQNGTVTPILPDSSSIEYTGMLLLKMAFPCGRKGKAGRAYEQANDVSLSYRAAVLSVLSLCHKNEPATLICLYV
jgi:hypothetical protein